LEEAEHLGVPGTAKEFTIFGVIIAGLGILFFVLLKDTPQAIASTIFMATIVGTLMFWRFRVAIAFAGVVILLLTNTMDLEHTIDYMNLDVVVFLIGMMIVVGFLKETGFYHWLSVKLIKLAKFKPRRLMVLFLFLCALMAALVDEVTSILFMTAIVFELCDYYKVNPVNYVISTVLATNIGSTWMMKGNPIGLLIGFRADLTFEDFIRWSFPVSFVGLIVLIFIVLVWQHKDLELLKTKMNAKPESGAAVLDEWAEVKDRTSFIGSVVLFLAVVITIVFHYRIELLLGLARRTVYWCCPITGAAAIMFWKRAKAREYLERNVDWWTLTFFLFLFAKAGCLAYTGVTDRIAGAATGLTADPILLAAIIALLSALGSAAMDNVVLIAAAIPVVQALGAAGVYTFPLWWSLLLGGCYGGNITMVGSTANIVALGMLEKQEGYYMTMRKWILIGLAGGLLPLIIAQSLLLVQLPLMP